MKDHGKTLRLGPDLISGYPGDEDCRPTPQELSELLGELRYDGLSEYLDALAKKLQRDSVSDGGRGKGQLATCLGRAAFCLEEAAHHVSVAWGICEPYTNPGGDPVKETDLDP